MGVKYTAYGFVWIFIYWAKLRSGNWSAEIDWSLTLDLVL